MEDFTLYPHEIPPLHEHHESLFPDIPFPVLPLTDLSAQKSIEFKDDKLTFTNTNTTSIENVHHDENKNSFQNNGSDIHTLGDELPQHVNKRQRQSIEEQKDKTHLLLGKMDAPLLSKKQKRILRNNNHTISNDQSGSSGKCLSTATSQFNSLDNMLLHQHQHHMTDCGLSSSDSCDFYRAYWKDNQIYSIGDWISFEREPKIINDNNNNNNNTESTHLNYDTLKSRTRYGIIKYFFLKKQSETQSPFPIRTIQIPRVPLQSNLDMDNNNISATQSSKSIPITIELENNSSQWKEFQMVVAELLPILPVPPFKITSFIVSEDTCVKAFSVKKALELE